MENSYQDSFIDRSQRSYMMGGFDRTLYHSESDQAAVKYVNILDPAYKYTAGYERERDMLDPHVEDIPICPVVTVDEAEADGPYCTDVIWFGSFSGLFLLAIVIGLFSTYNINSRRLLSMPNYAGEYCGLDAAVKGRPYLYYPLDPSGGSLVGGSPKLLIHAGQCVSDCPGMQSVGKPMPIPMMQNEIDDANPGTSGIIVRYTVQSPMYATTLEGDSICLPVEKTLRKVVLRETTSSNIQWRRAIGTCFNAWPAMARDLLIGMTTFGFLTKVLSSALPRLSLQLLIISFVTSLLAMGATMTWWGFREAYSLPFQYAEHYPMSPRLAQLCGIVVLLTVPCSLIFVLANWGVLWEGATHCDALKDAIRDLAGTTVAPLVLCGLVTGVVIIWSRAILSLASHSFTVPAYSMADVQTGLAAPLLQKTMHFSPLCLFAMIIISVAALWGLYLLRSSARFSGAYVAVVWYFAPALTCGCDERDISGIEGLRALQTALSVSAGTNALYGASMIFIGPLKTLFGFASRRKSPHLTPSDGDQLSALYPTTTPAESPETAQWLADRMSRFMPFVAAILDAVHSAALTEVILNGRDLIIGMDHSRRRMVTRGPLTRPTVASRFVGSYGLLGTLTSLTFAIWASLSSFMSVSSKSVYYKLATDGTPKVEESFRLFRYTQPGSTSFVSNPVVVAAITFMMVYLFTDMFMGFLEGIVDAITYCYIVDLQSRTGSVNDHGRLYNVDEHPCDVERAPNQLKLLLSKVLEHELGLDLGRRYAKNAVFP